MARRQDRHQQRRIALARINQLMQAAAGVASGDPNLANRYAFLARKLAMRHQTGLPAGSRTLVCRACSAYTAPGVTGRTRIRGGRVVTTCLHCGNVRRRPIRGTKKETSQ